MERGDPEGTGGQPLKLREGFSRLVARAAEELQQHYGDRLVSVAVFGSVGRGTPSPFSDVDLLIVAEPLPRGRLARVAEFQDVEEKLEPILRELADRGIRTELSPVFKTPSEVKLGSPLFLDMVEDARLLYDRNGFLSSYLAQLKRKLRESGARRLPYRGSWYWDLHPRSSQEVHS